jgi:hypothetical protein
MQNGFSSNFNTPHKLNDVFDFMLTQSMERFDFPMGLVVRFKKQQSKISHSINYGFSTRLLATVEALKISDILQLRAETESDIFIHQFPVKLNSRLQKLNTELTENSLCQGLTVLLRNKGQLFAALHLWHNQKIHLTDSHHLEFAAFNKLLEMALEVTSDLSDALPAPSTIENELIALNSIISGMHRTTDLNGVLSRALKEMLDVLDLEAGGIYLIDKTKGHAQLVTSEVPASEFGHPLDHFKLRNPAVTTVLQADKSLVTLELAFQSHAPRQNCRRKHATRIVTIPVRSRNQIMGFINLLVPLRRMFTSDEIYLMDSVSKQIGVAVEYKMINKKMEKISLKNAQVVA